MKIGVDATCFANPRGYGRYTKQVLTAMVDRSPDDTFVCFVDDRAAAEFDLTRPNVRRVVVTLSDSPTLAASAKGRRSIPDMLRLTRAVRQENPDVFFSPSVYSFFPLPPRMRAVVTIHDTIVERFPQLTIPNRVSRLMWHAKIRAALWQATLVLTVSRTSAADISSILRVPKSRIRIAVEAPAECFRPSTSNDISETARRFDIPAGRSWIMYVGGFNPHKNVRDLVRAHGVIARRMKDDAPLLVLVGPVSEDVFHESVESIRAAIADKGTESLVRWTGYVPDAELRHLYAGAQALVLPSEAEGFGLPAVEAARCGTPVIATTVSPLPELLAGGGFFVTPGDVEGLTSALSTLCGDPAIRASMGNAALERTRDLSWDRTAADVIAALYEAGSASRAAKH
jgi:glycosyltransferase involved in cell wall biosynthesis